MGMMNVVVPLTPNHRCGMGIGCRWWGEALRGCWIEGGRSMGVSMGA